MTVETLPRDPYWSRTAASWEVAVREDPVVWGRSNGPLTAEQTAAYAERGYHVHPSLYSPAAAGELLAAAHRLADAADPQHDDVILEPGGDAVRSVFRVHRTSDRFKAVCKSPELVGIARQLLGGDVYVYQSRINFKPAFSGKEFFWHSDFETWHIEDGMPRMRAVSVSINLTENHEFNGPLMVAPGSHGTYVRCVGATPEDHYQQSLRKQEYGVPHREALELLVDQGGIVAPKGRPGSALFFECNLMHGSVGNLSPHPRTNLFVVYNSVENAAVAPFGGGRPRPDFLADRDATPIDDL